MIDKRSRTILESVIKERIIKDIIFHSDCLSSYVSLFEPVSNYQHYSVFGDQNIEDPGIRAHTQSIESFQ